MFDELKDRFISYAKKNTRSDERSQRIPTTKSQVEFALDLAEELKSIGLDQVAYHEESGFVTALLPANSDRDLPCVGFISHMDTADFESENIQPQVHPDYQGQMIQLNEDYNLSADQFPQLKNYLGQTLITTDGRTLLGADDKAGIAEIVTAMVYLLNHPEIERGPVKVAFGPDEEIGRGATHFDVESFGADFAYTVDGGPVGELQYESFNAAQANVSIHGLEVHPGTAKNQMVNAIQIGVDLINRLPEEAVPEKTDGRQGFIHIMTFEGGVEESRIEMIIRDHDRKAFEEKKSLVESIVVDLNDQYGSGRVTLDLYDQYYNMAEVIQENMRPVELAQQAMVNLDITPIVEPIRGGTDGSILSFMGLPTPNLFAGGENFHGRYEFVAVESMVQACRTIIEIIRLIPL